MKRISFSGVLYGLQPAGKRFPVTFTISEISFDHIAYVG